MQLEEAAMNWREESERLNFVLHEQILRGG